MSRSLYYCSSLPAATQVALRRAGYETVDDLLGVSAETLSKGAPFHVLSRLTQSFRVGDITKNLVSISRIPKP